MNVVVVVFIFRGVTAHTTQDIFGTTAKKKKWWK